MSVQSPPPGLFSCLVLLVFNFLKTNLIDLRPAASFTFPVQKELGHSAAAHTTIYSCKKRPPKNKTRNKQKTSPIFPRKWKDYV